MDSVLELNPYACKGFEMHSFKPGQCRECSLSWKQHKGVIDDAMCKKLYEDEQKREAEQQAKAAAKAARENANTFENRYKRRQSNPVNEMPKDDWYCDEEGESGARAFTSLLDVDDEPEDDQFTMQVIEPSITPSQQPLKGVKVRNLLEEFDEMNVTTPKTAVPSPDSFSSPPDSTDAPVELVDALSFRLQELNEQERNRKAAESSRKEADDYRQDLELVKIENEVLREELKDAHEALRRVGTQDAKGSNGDEQSQCSCGTGTSGGEEACVQTDADRSSAGTSIISGCVQSDAGQMRSDRSVCLEQDDQQEWRDEQGMTQEEIASLMLELTDITVKTLADRICTFYGEVHLAWDEYRKLDRERQGQLLAMLAERDSEIRALREREEQLNWRVANSTHAQGNATQRRFECRGFGNSLDEETRGGLVLPGPISRLLRALPISGPLKVANYAVGTSKEAMRCAVYCFGYIQYYATSPEPPTFDENPDRFADCNV